jgi:hypothetical protein
MKKLTIRERQRYSEPQAMLRFAPLDMPCGFGILRLEVEEERD